MKEQIPTLQHTEETYDEEVKPGDIVVFQCFADNSKDIPTVEIKLLKIAKVDLENGMFTPEDSDIQQPLYRIRYVVNKETGKTPFYKGYDYYQIAISEGQMSQETYDEIKAMRASKGIDG